MMVSDVRFKVRMRIRSAVDEMRHDISRTWELDVRVGSDDRSADVRAERHDGVRCWFEHRFPGCQVLVTATHVSIYLPDRYPRHQVPITESLPPWLCGFLRGNGIRLGPRGLVPVAKVTPGLSARAASVPPPF